MGCFIVPGAEAIVTTIATHVVKKAEAKKVPERYTVCNHEGKIVEVEKISFSKKLGWLNKMLAGGSGLLMFEHIWHGEVVPFFPFLTAASDPAEFSAMLAEMSTAGMTMAVLVTCVWGCMVAGSSIIEKRAIKSKEYSKLEA